ncbi:hypothetical protein F5883DRAFT_172792 [Diaporthe sp. PMI_573]|nr:hypothetical protein F5883DRAFT_172792 [Diaporthaceae sp. PMI_573]
MLELWMSHLRRDNSREERTMAVFDSVIELMMLMPDSICAGPQASLVCVCASRERQATEVRHYHAVPVDLTQPARPSCTMTNRFANLRALRVRLSQREASGGIDSAHIDMFPSRVFGSSNGELDDGEADNAARHRAMLMGTIVPCRQPETPQHKSSGDNGPGLEPYGAFPHHVRSPQSRAAIRDKILNFPFLGQRSEAGMVGGDTGVCRDPARA